MIASGVDVRSGLENALQSILKELNKKSKGVNN